MHDVDYKKWGSIAVRTAFIISAFILVTEIVGNTMLYLSRSQGYGPDTIVEKLLRYLVLTSVLHFAIAGVADIVNKRVKSEAVKKYLLMLCITFICGDVAYSHYQFATTLLIFIVPLIVSMIYEDTKLTSFVLVLSCIGEAIAVISRGSDPLYSTDIAPEASIAFACILSVFVFARIITSTMVSRRDELKDAVVAAAEAKAASEKMELSLKMLETLAGTIDAKDKYTNGHSLRVSAYATKLAEALGWNESKITQLKYEALLHDIGKIGVPDQILNKPSRLTETEFALIQSHTVVGADILKNMAAFPNASEVAKHHHERFDGKGYPNALSDNDIPLNAKIVCIADSYDAMNSDRIYRKALPQDVIREELVKGRGTQFDAEMLDVFLELFDAGKLNINDDELMNVTSEEQHQNVMEDIEKVLVRMNALDGQKNEIDDFDKFYNYMRSIGLRYNRSIEVLSVDLIPENSDMTEDYMRGASKLLEMAIRKNIRAVDMYYRYSAAKHLVILLDAGVDNLHIVQNRIRFDFNLDEIGKMFKLNFTLNESIDAPNKNKEK